MTSTSKDEYILVKTKTGKYYHPVRSLAYDDGKDHSIKRLGCMEKPTAVWECDENDLQTMKPCIACAMWIVYGRARPE
jgi:hypothetical protein